jgi:transketolase
VVTCEDHHVASGLGASVALGLLHAGLSPRFASFGVHRYGDSGPSGEVFAAMGLTPEQLVEGVRRLAGASS